MLFVPYHTQRNLARPPVVTYVLIALNTAFFLLTTILILQGSGQEVLQALGVVPGHLRLHTLLTSQFIHDSPLPFHLLGNMLFLYAFGPPVEDILGRRKFVAFYLLAGVCSAFTHLLMAYAFFPNALDVPMIGASGAIAGVMGFVALRLYRTRVSIWYLLFFFLFLRTGVVEIPASVALGAWAVWDLFEGLLSLAEGSSGGVAHWAHVGGFAMGLLWALGMKFQVPEVDEYTYEDALEAARQGRWAEARRKLGKLVEQQPQNAEAAYWLAVTLKNTNFTESARRYFAQAVRLSLNSGQVDQSFAAYQELLALDPHYDLPATLEMPLGSALTQAGQYARALHVFHRIVTRQPDTPEAEAALLRMGQLYLEKLHQPQEAWKVFRAFRQRYPHSSWAAAARQWENQAAAQRRG